MVAAKFRAFLDRSFTWRVQQLDRRLQAIGSFNDGSGEHLRPPSELIPVLMIIDVEPDGFFIPRDDPLPWRGYERVHEFFHEFRPLCSQVTGRATHYCWYLRIDPQIAEVYGDPAWVRKRYRNFIDENIAAGDEIGLHPHDYRWDLAANSWVVDHGNQAWIDLCVRMSFDVFHQSFGRVCDSFRFGDRWMNDETLRLIESLGARFDLTLEPGRTAALASFPNKPFTGSLPDYSNVPYTPFRPSRQDFRKSDPSRSDGIWMIPLSAAVTDDCSALVRSWKKIIGDPAPDPVYHTLNLAHDPEFFIAAIDRAFRASASSYLAFVIRSDIASNPKLFVNLSRNFTALLAHPLARRFVFSTPAECMRLLRLIQTDEPSGLVQPGTSSASRARYEQVGRVTPADSI